MILFANSRSSPRDDLPIIQLHCCLSPAVHGKVIEPNLDIEHVLQEGSKIVCFLILCGEQQWSESAATIVEYDHEILHVQVGQLNKLHDLQMPVVALVSHLFGGFQCA